MILIFDLAKFKEIPFRVTEVGDDVKLVFALNLGCGIHVNSTASLSSVVYSFTKFEAAGRMIRIEA